MAPNNATPGPGQGIPGVTLAGTTPTEPPMLLVIGPEKSGKSSLVTTLFDWPEKGKVPLVMAWDATGPDSCAKLGFQVPVLKVRDQVGANYWDKAKTALGNIERAFANGQRPFNSIVIDCASTMFDKLFTEDCRLNISKDPRRNYGNVLNQSREFLARITELPVPSIWLAWLQAPFIEVKGDGPGAKYQRQTLGGPLIPGQFRPLVSGKAHMILILDKQKVPGNTPGICSDGFQRVLHTKTWENIEAGGRYQLPEPTEAHLGKILEHIMRGPGVNAGPR